MVDADVVAEQRGLAVVDVQQQRQLGLVQAAEVQEARVLAEVVGVVAVVHGAVDVARQQHEALGAGPSQAGEQGVAAGGVGLGGKHGHDGKTSVRARIA